MTMTYVTMTMTYVTMTYMIYEIYELRITGWRITGRGLCWT